MIESQQPNSSSIVDAVAVFVDCNCFLQLRDLKDQPWNSLFPEVTRVEIMVMPSVLSELDKKKVDPKDRIRNRARAAIKLIDAASTQDPMRLVLKQGPVLVALSLPDVGPTDWSNHPRLDQTRPDDALVAQSLDTVTDLPKWLVSHDSGPRVTARRCDLNAKNVPDEWLLPDPVDEDRKKIQRLQRENETLKARYPNVVARWADESDQPTPLLVSRLIVPPLSGDAIMALVAECRETWPHATATMRVGQGFFIGDDDTSGQFDQDDYGRYATKWHEWVAGLPHFLESLPQRIAAASRLGAAHYRLDNVGSATAEGLTVGFEVSEGWRVLADQDETNAWGSLPLALPKPPPTPYQGDQMDRARRADEVTRQVRNTLSSPIQEPRDPTGFYWTDRPSHDSRHGSFECAEFRAKRGKDEVIWLRPVELPPIEGRLTIDIHGSNLSEPLPLELLLRFEERSASWHDNAVVDLLDPWLADAIRNLTNEE